MTSIRSHRNRSSLIAGKALMTSLFWIAVTPVQADEKLDLAASAFDLGLTTSQLIWKTVSDGQSRDTVPATKYDQLAKDLQAKIDAGRASTSLLTSTAGFASASLTYAAVLDPEPTSKLVAGIAAYGAKKGSDLLSQKVIDDTNASVQEVLVLALKESLPNPAKLRAMTADQLREQVADFQIGGQKLRNVLKDSPKALEVMQNSGADLLMNVSVETLSKVAAVSKTAEEIKAQLTQTATRLDAYQTAVNAQFENVKSALSALADNAQDASQKLDALQSTAAKTAQDLQGLAEVSYSGWSTSQKLSALNLGLFSNLSPDTQTALRKSLDAQLSVERSVSRLNNLTQDLSYLDEIAKNVGLELPKAAIAALKVSQTSAGSVAKFLGGDYLGALASVTSLFGLGGPDLGAQRQQQIMSAFAQVNAKLDEIVDLQVKTLDAIQALAKSEAVFHQDVLGRLDRIEIELLQNKVLLQELVLAQWQDCLALYLGPLNRRAEVSDQDNLREVLGNASVSDYASGCFYIMAQTLDSKVRGLNWAGSIIAADSFPADKIISAPQLQQAVSAFQLLKGRAFDVSRAFVSAELANKGKAPSIASFLARTAQPQANTAASSKLSEILATAKPQLDSYKCGSGLLAAALRTMACEGSAGIEPPTANRLKELIDADLIGPQGYWIIDVGMVLSTLVDFSRRTAPKVLEFVNDDAISSFMTKPPTPEFMLGIKERKGVGLLRKLQWLAEMAILQQAITYGDYTAALVESELYDPILKALVIEPEKLNDPVKVAAANAMKWNPTLARNVVMIALRHAVEDTVGGRSQAAAQMYRESYYQHALANFVGPDVPVSETCNKVGLRLHWLNDLFPNWNFEYRATADEKKKAEFNDCVPETLNDVSDPKALKVAQGHGLVVSYGDFYVQAPSIVTFSRGFYEQPDSLRLALTYRDRLAQRLVDHSVSDELETITSGDKPSIGAMAFGVLNSAGIARARSH